MSTNIRFKKVLSILLMLIMTLSFFNFQTISVSAATPPSFPNIYPADKLIKLSSGEISNRVEALLKTMTTAEMYTMLGGSSATSTSNGSKGYGTGYLRGVPRLGVPVMRIWLRSRKHTRSKRNQATRRHSRLRDGQGL